MVIFMKTILTLSIDKDLLEKAKAFSRQTGKPLSKIISDYLAALVQQVQEDDDEELTPLVKSLRGIAAGSDVGIEDYHNYLEEKYK